MKRETTRGARIVRESYMPRAAWSSTCTMRSRCSTSARTWSILVIAALITLAGNARAAELPACNAAEVQRTMADVFEANNVLFGPTDMNASRADMRWCTAVLGLIAGPCVLATVMLEWQDEATGRWWLQSRSVRRCVPEQMVRGPKTYIVGPGSCR